MTSCNYKRTKDFNSRWVRGVGTFAIQLAKIMGATVTTTASEAGANLVTSLGADEIINYKTEKFEDILKIMMGYLIQSAVQHLKNHSIL